MASDVMTEDPVTIPPTRRVAEAAQRDRAAQAQPAARRRARPARRRRHADRRPRRADGRVIRAQARIDTGAIERNCARLAALAPLCAVVKADGYGHGAVEAARAAQRGGASWLAVATAGEAAELRAAGIDGPLLVMGALSPEELRRRAGRRRRRGRLARGVRRAVCHGDVGVHVKLDTGMGRLGTRDPAEATRVAEAVRRRGLAARGRDDPLRHRRRRSRSSWREQLDALPPVGRRAGRDAPRRQLRRRARASRRRGWT